MSRKTTRYPAGAGLSCAVALLTILASLSSPSAGAIERYLAPDDSAGGPFYARLEQGLVHMTDQWVAIAFYREPSCVRPDFNLLDFFDFANIPAIFGCPLTAHGFEIWKNGVASDPAPMQSKLFGNGALPIWFVSVSDFQSAMPGLTLIELEAMPSLRKGYATFFEETLHPTGGAQQTMLQISSYGWLEDGAFFRYEATEAGGALRKVQIEIK